MRDNFSNRRKANPHTRRRAREQIDDQQRGTVARRIRTADIIQCRARSHRNVGQSFAADWLSWVGDVAHALAGVYPVDGREPNRKMVPRGLEPRTFRLLAERSNQLSYETLRCCGRITHVNLNDCFWRERNHGSTSRGCARSPPPPPPPPR